MLCSVRVFGFSRGCVCVAELSGSLTLQTTMNTSYRVPVSGVGVLCPLRLSHSVVKFGAAVVGEVLVSSVYLTNTFADTGAPKVRVCGSVCACMRVCVRASVEIVACFRVCAMIDVVLRLCCARVRYYVPLLSPHSVV